MKLVTLLFIRTTKRDLNLFAPTPQNGQTHTNNSSAVADELLGVFDHFVGLTLKGITDTTMTKPKNMYNFSLLRLLKKERKKF